MKTKKYISSIILACLTVILSHGLRAQTSSVTLANLLVTNHLTDAPEINKIMVMFDVSDIDNLSMIQVQAAGANDYKDALIVNLPIIHKEGKHLISFGKNLSLPISGKPKVIFFLDVPDQIKKPYHFIRLTGFDTNGITTNTLEFNKK